MSYESVPFPNKGRFINFLILIQIKSNQALFSNLYKYKHVIHDEIYIFEKIHILIVVTSNKTNLKTNKQG